MTATPSPPVPEPPRDIEAQLRATVDPDHPKPAAFCVPADVHLIPPTIDAYVVARPEGTLVTLHKQRADAFKRAADDVTMAWLLGLPEPKPLVVERCGPQFVIRARMVQARDADGCVLTEAITSPRGYFETVKAMQNHVPEDGQLAVLLPVMAITRRVALRWAQR